jgi:undecaprenyl-diphosphatase
MIPGVSRAGATIMGGLLLGLDRRAATEFSFFLAVPTMLAASVYDLYKNWDLLSADSFLVIAVGFVAAFLSALLVVRWLIGFVSRHGFGPFAWYRIVVGLVMAAFLLLR